MLKRRVVVTGQGVITPVGLNVNEFWTSLIEGKSGIGPVTVFDTKDIPTKIGAQVKGFDPLQYMSKKDANKMAQFTQFALASAKQAVEQAQLRIDETNASRVGVVVGSGAGGMDVVEENFNKLFQNGPKRVSSYYVSSMMINSAPGEISIALGAKGPSYAVVTACATGSNSIGEAMRAIQYGTVDVMIAGGSESNFGILDLASFANIHALSRRNDQPQQASRPFDRNRDGFVIGGGAGIVVLEELEHALKRGAPILAELVGYGCTTDAHHITAPDPTGLGAAEAIRIALKDGGLSPQEVGYVNAHGTSTPFNDQMEINAIKTVFGEHAPNLAISSIKSITGHLMGGAGAVELIATVLSMIHSKVPPTLNCDNPEDLELNFVPHVAQEREIEAAISNSFGFGGHNVCLAVRKWRGH
ncbi:beta-ketoacyl-[acyl-carrier-protein] synthase II [Paenibacillus elgii]|uniref:3-oxoacyl-[acyl-carrier-protein] synthase 2 n=1 Tax=Paenibacillus elgii TaxID=189691 RepID=A0A2T6G709_9BACL|nr:beta-ketoacyl-ACP synthase II [Paenibacillus elgii]PUA39938.1 beta-ketoacyl-[acyl-carrier-protein] synthase II [Paenibacillus elgii]